MTLQIQRIKVGAKLIPATLDVYNIDGQDGIPLQAMGIAGTAQDVQEDSQDKLIENIGQSVHIPVLGSILRGTKSLTKEKKATATLPDNFTSPTKRTKVMKRLRCARLVVLMLCSAPLHAQEKTTPEQRISVTYNKNTYLIFGDKVQRVDAGNADLLFSLEDNIVTVSAAIQDHEETSLFVVLESGEYAYFHVTYADTPSQQLYVFGEDNAPPGQLEKLPITPPTKHTDHIADGFALLSSGQGERTPDGVISRKISLLLTHLLFHEDTLFMRLILDNKSGIYYAIGLIQLSVQSKKKLKKTATQRLDKNIAQQQIRSLKQGTQLEILIATQRFTLDKHQALHITVFEDKGNRNLSIKTNQME